MVFEANDALTDADPPNAPAAPAVAANEANLYEWFDGELRLVNVLPGNNAAVPDAVIGSGRLLAPKPLTRRRHRGPGDLRGWQPDLLV